MFTSSPTDSTVSLPTEPEDAQPYMHTDFPLVISTQSEDYPELVHPTPTTTMKFEPLYDEHSLLFLHPHDTLESLSPPTAHSDTSLGYHGSNGSSPEDHQHLEDSVLGGHWTPPERLGSGETRIGDYRQLSDFHLAETGESAHPLSNSDEPDYGSYPNGFGFYSFPGIMADSGTPYY